MTTQPAFDVGNEKTQVSYFSMMELLGSGVLVLDRRGEPLFANAQARKWLSGAILDDDDSDTALSGGVKKLLSLLDAAADTTGGGERPPARAVLPWPAAAPLQIEVAPLAGDPRRGYVLVLNSGGVNDLVAAELLAASRMRARDYLYQALLHDLRAPLNALEINLELLADNCTRVAGAAGDETERHQVNQGLDVLREELARLNRTLRAVLGGGEGSQPRAECFDLAAALREVAQLLSPQAKQQRVVIQRRFPDGAVLMEGHRDRLKQAFINVAVNALEAMPAGGALTMAIARDGDAVRIRFEDDGDGIPERLRERAFDACFSTKAGGSGMGLFVARLVARAHGGDVRIDGARRSAIEFQLPACP